MTEGCHLLIPRYLHSVYTLTAHFYKIQFNIIFQLDLLMIPNKNYVYIPDITRALNMSGITHPS
jgi:hypothetical protein